MYTTVEFDVRHNANPLLGTTIEGPALKKLAIAIFVSALSSAACADSCKATAGEKSSWEPR
jgi:hypothetical protein